MAKDNLEEIFRKAGKIAKQVPESMQAVAFERALDELLGGGGKGEARKPSGGGSKSKHTSNTGSTDSTFSIDQIIEAIDRTRYPDIADAPRVLDKSLYVLRLVKNDVGHDGLTSSEIAKILTDKFRISTSRQAVNEALGSQSILVDLRKRGRSSEFRIMDAGETHVEERAWEKDEAATVRPRRRSGKKKSKSTKKSKATKSDLTSGGGSLSKKATKKKAKAKGARKGHSRPGPKAALKTLIDDGFFAKPRGIGDIIEHLRHSTGHAYKQTDLSPALVRLLRESALTRTQNSDNQYEYKNG